MAKTTLKPWPNEDISVEIETTEVLTSGEAEEVKCGIRIACAYCLPHEPHPCTGEIRQAILETNPQLAEKLIRTKFC